jgi:hydrogenase maturation protease
LRPTPESVLILGLGNVYCGDDGLGVAALDLLGRCYRLPGGVAMLDGSAHGMSLLQYARTADALIIVDAIRNGGEPGSFTRLEGDELASAPASRFSAHQVGVADLLAGLRLIHTGPEHIVLLGLAPKTRELGGRTSKEVARALDMLVEAIAAETDRLGFPLIPRDPDDSNRGRAPTLVPNAARA